MMEADGDEKSKFLTKLEKFDGRRILYNMDNLLALPRYRRLHPCGQEIARRFVQEYVDGLAKSGNEMLSGVDFDDVKHNDLSEFIGDEKCLIGKAFFGRFLLGTFEQDKKIVVIKTWDLVDPLEDYLIEHPARLHNEIMLLTNEHLNSHPHVPKLIGYCVHKRLAAIYDFNPKGVLRNALQDGDLGWDARMKVATQVAKLLYEFHYTLKIVIGSLDSSNILIDERDDIKLCEFGLIARMPKMAEGKWLLNYTAGLYSHFAPENAEHIHSGATWTPKIDVYAFGTLLLELITKERFEPYALPWWAIEKLARGEKCLVDKSLLDDVENGTKITELAMDCLNMDPEKRLDVGTIMRKLEDLTQGIVSKKPKVGT